MATPAPRKRVARKMQKAAESNDKFEALIALRDYLAKALDECDSARDKAALANRFMDCVREIDACGIPVESEETVTERAEREAQAFLTD